MDKFPVLVVEDNPQFRELLRKQLSHLYRDIQTFATAEEMFVSRPWLTPAVLLVDIHLPGVTGLDLLSRISTEGWPCVAIVLSGSESVDEVIAAFRSGAIDFLRKPHSSSELEAAIARAEAALIEKLRLLRAREQAKNIRLSPREAEVTRHLAKGHQSKLIAYDLGISVRTVELHRSNIIAKLGARSAGHAVLIARELGLIDPE